jgi:predicted alpha/beta hydrolase
LSNRSQYIAGGQLLAVQDHSNGNELKFPALDGYVLGGIHFESQGEFVPHTAVVIAAGAGIPAKRYRYFASFLAASGIPVLTFDYRGIGLSRPRSLRGFNARAEDWSEADCGGAIQWMRARYPDARLAGVAHSIGSLIIGGAPNLGECAQLVFIASHTGYFGDYGKRRRIPMALLWHGVMPLLAHLFGYFPASLLRLGEDIPRGIALQWAARRTPELRPEATGSDTSRARAMLARFDAIKVPIHAFSFSDDAFATTAGARRLLAVYSGVEAAYERIEPASVGLASIGHLGFLRRDAEARLWPQILACLKSSGPTGPSAATQE